MITFSPGAVHRKQAPNGNFCNKIVLMSNVGFQKLVRFFIQTRSLMDGHNWKGFGIFHE